MGNEYIKDTDIDKNQREKNKINKILILIILLLIFILGFIGFWFLNQDRSSAFENRVNEITEIDYSKQQATLNQLVADGMMNVQYSLSAEFNGKVSTSFNVKNIKNNHYPIVFSIFDEDDNEIYQSKKIERGYEINSIELNKELPKGSHDCKIQIGYAEEGNVSSSFPITIVVK